MKQKAAQFTVLWLILTFLITGCGGSHAAGIAPVQPASGLAASAGKFVLFVDPDSFIAGGKLDGVSLRTTESGGDLLVDVVADHASGLKALYFDLQYDAGVFYPLSAVTADNFAQAGQRLDLSILRETGVVHHGQVLIHPQLQSGYSGSGVLAQVRFGHGALAQHQDAIAAEIARYASAAPTTSGARSDITWIDSSTVGIFWCLYSPGDYNQDGRVSITDLTPLGMHFGDVGPFATNSIDGVIDGDQNGLVGIGDLTVIGSNFDKRITKFNLYASDSFSDYPQDPAASTIAPYAEKAFSDPQLPDTQFHPGPLRNEGRLVYSALPVSIQWGDAQNFSYYWIRPVDGTVEGTPSMCLCGAFGTTADLPVLAVQGATGTGFYSDPYILDPAQDYQLKYTDPLDGDVTTSAGVRYRIVDEDGKPIPQAHVDKATGKLLIDDTFHQDLILEAYYKGRGVGIFWGRNAGFPADGLRCKLSGPLQPPVPVGTAAPLSGSAPLTVHFDGSQSYDPDDYIKTISWNYDLSTGSPINGATLDHTYDAAGFYTAQLLVMDSYGQYAHQNFEIEVKPDAGALPIARLRVLPDTSGAVPFNATFSADADACAGRTITTYLWDLDGNAANGFEVNTGPVPSAEITYLDGGLFNCRLQVIDSTGATAESSLNLILTGESNKAPVPVVTPQSQSGEAPLTVDFDASSSFDPDGTIANYSWDYDGDGIFDVYQSLIPTGQFTYTTPGSIYGVLQVADNKGRLATTGFNIRIGQPPYAYLNPLDGLYTAPITIDFDASASTDNNGSIVEYRWDFNNDGVDDATTTVPTTSHKFLDSGYYTIKLTVVDNDGLTDRAFQGASIY